MTVWRVASLVVVMAVLLFPLQASAVDLNQWVRGLKFSPFVTQRVEYETNVFQVTSRTQDDLISRTVPGFLLTLERGPLTLGAGYRAEFLRFMDLEEQDNTHHIATYRLGLAYGFLKVSLGSDLTLTSDPPTTELTGRTDSTTITLAPDFEFRLTPRFSVGVNYGFTSVRYEKRAEELNHIQHTFGGSVFWKLVPKADVRLGYSYGYSEFDNVTFRTDRDVSAQHDIFVALRGDLTPKLSSTFRIGYGLRDQESPRLEDPSTLTLGGDWTYKPTERTRITLATSRAFQDSIFGEFGETVTFVSSTGTLAAEQQFGTKVRANARLTGVLNEYPRKEVTLREPFAFRHRNDTILGWGTGVDYDIQKWLSIGAEYSHTRRDSNFDEFNYKDDKITAKVTLQF